MIKEKLLEKLLRKIRISKVIPYLKKSDYICDIGCGINADFLMSIKSFINKGWGIDKKVLLDSADNITIKRIELFSSVPFDDNFFDVVTMMAVLEHLNNISLILKEVYRILKPNGILILTTPNPSAKPILEFLAYKLNLLDVNEISDHKYYCSMNNLIKELQNAKLKVIKSKFFEFKFNSLIIAKKL